MIVTTTLKHQFTIPKVLRSELHIQPGQNFKVSILDGSIVLTPIPNDPIKFLFGIFKDEPSMTEELLNDRKQDR